MGPVVSEIRIRRATRSLDLAFADGHRISLPAEYLRVESPSAEVQGHAPSQKQWVSGKRDVNIAAVEPIGNYAVRIRFSDGHDTGIFSWSLLRTLGQEQAERWQVYLLALNEKGLSRDP